MRRTLIAPLLVAALGLSLAQVPHTGDGALSLESAMAVAVDAAAAVRSARMDLNAAERDRTRVLADPTTLRIARLQAEHGVDRAVAALEGATASTEDAAARAFTDALEADDRLRLAEAALGIAGIVREATAIQLEAGAATRLDVERSDNDQRAAERDVEDARAARALAYDRLASLLGLPSQGLHLERPDPPGAVPPLERALADGEANAQLQAVVQQVELAEAQFAAVDNPLASAPADVAAARDRLDAARLQVDEQRRSLVLIVRQAHNAALAAEARLRSAEAAAATARDDLGVQRLRFDAGGISALALARAELQTLQQEAQLAAARHGLGAALRQLRLTAMGAR